MSQKNGKKWLKAAAPVSQKRLTLFVSLFCGLMGKLKVGKTVSRMRQLASQMQGNSGTAGRQSTAPGRKKGRHAVLSRLPGAIARAVLMIALIILPYTMLPTTDGDGAMIVLIIAIFVGGFTIAEYASASPSLIEFRDAPPFNRIRFTALSFTVFSLLVIFSGDGSQSTFVLFFDVIGHRIGMAMDFPYSPVRLMQVMLPADSSDIVVENMRTAAGIAYFVSLLSLALFVILLRLRIWPRHTQTFNFWVNLPTFDPTTGIDVVDRLNRDSAVNLVLGFLLPFMIPAGIKLTAAVGTPIGFDDPQTMIWTVAIWAFLPSSLLMRGVALSRVAGMIHVQRKKAYAAAAAEGMLPV